MNRLTLVIFIYVLAALFNMKAFGQSEFELSCRAKAKEIAADSYRGCMTEQRAAQIEQIKKDYQEKLNSLKVDYEKEIEKLGGKSGSSGKKSSGKMMAKSSKKSSGKSTSGRPRKEKVDMTTQGEYDTGEESQLEIPEPVPVESVPNESSL